MKINVIEQIGTELETYQEEIINESGEIELVEKQREIPKYAAVTRDMTPEEEQEYLSSIPQDNRTYEEKIVDFIRERYSLNDELAILRQRDSKPNEFNEYNLYVEECKVRARQL